MWQGLPVKTASGEVVFAPNKQQQRLLTASKVQVEGVTVQDDLLTQQKQQRQSGGRKGRESAKASDESGSGRDDDEEPAAAEKAEQQAQKVAAAQPGEDACLLGMCVGVSRGGVSCKQPLLLALQDNNSGERGHAASHPECYPSHS
jgi:hypothetical protein